MAVLLGFMTWGIASHAIGAIQDIAYDRAAGIGSIATVLGGRATAWVALIGYGVAVAMTFTVEQPWGAIAAIALAPYLLLPLMVLLRDDETQARRAWRSFMQLNIPAGFVIAHELSCGSGGSRRTAPGRSRSPRPPWSPAGRC